MIWTPNSWQAQPFNPNATGIDHISYVLDPEQEEEWYAWLERNIQKSPDARWAKPHITLAYSVDPIEGFPDIGWDNSETYPVPPIQEIHISNENKPFAKFFTDPMGHHHIIIDLSCVAPLYALHKHYLSIGATWDESRMGPYIPFIFAVKDASPDSKIAEGKQWMPFTDTNRMGIVWRFNMIRFSRFSEDRTAE